MELFYVILLLSIQLGTLITQIIDVRIPDGTLRGAIMADYDGAKFYGFTKIPYAKPPLGELRFKDSEENEPWKGILNVSQPIPECVQPNGDISNMKGQEDCLYLNVFTKSTDKYASMPVLVFIHGGAFIDGVSSEFGPDFLMTKNIVLVTLNYRLGIYGFLNTVNSKIAKDKEMFGNMGFKDQVLALKWVQNNIKYFGGNPKKVTISGQSAGGMSVHAHVLSPLSVDLFHQAIPMSGSSLTAKIHAANDTATPLAKYLGLNTTNYDAMMQGLRTASNQDLFRAAKDLLWFHYKLDKPNLACLVIEKPGENSFMTDYPLNILRRGNYKYIPILIGNTNKEGMFIYGREAINENLKNLSSSIAFFFKNREEVTKKLSQFYKLDSEDPVNRIEFNTYAWYKYSTFRAAREHAKRQRNVYYYQFAAVGKLNFQKNKMPMLKQFDGACHADDLGYLYSGNLRPDSGSIEEKIMRTEINLWANFVKYGKPMRSLRMFKENNHNFINISNSGTQIGLLNEKSFDLWDDLYENYCDGPY